MSQDIQIFPGLLRDVPEGNPIPSGVTSHTVKTSDGEQLEVWHLPAKSSFQGRRRAAIVFHGNGGTVHSFFDLQRWLSESGISSYGFDYRGFGNSTGWPSEEGLEQDAHAVWEFAKRRENLAASDFLFLGLSVGTGPASYLATEIDPAILLLISPYSSIPNVVKDRPVVSMLTAFLWYEFPVEQYVQSIPNSCLIVAQGQNDKTILPYHSDRVAKAHSGRFPVQRVISKNAHHNNVFTSSWKELRRAVRTCFKLHEAATPSE